MSTVLNAAHMGWFAWLYTTDLPATVIVQLAMWTGSGW